MSRTRASARNAATGFETLAANYLATHVDDRIERRRLNGTRDRGDLSGFRFMGQRIVVEAKDYGGRLQVGPWLKEAEVERGNDDAGVALVVAKRNRHAAAGDQIVLLTLRDLVSLLTGTRPDDE